MTTTPIVLPAQRVLADRYRWLEDGIADPSGEGAMIPPEVKPTATPEDTASSSDATPPANDDSDGVPAAEGVH